MSWRSNEIEIAAGTANQHIDTRITNPGAEIRWFAVWFALIALSATTLPPHARADDNYWINPSGGAWIDASNWSSGKTGGAAVFNQDTSYTVSLGNALRGCTSLDVQSGSGGIVFDSGGSQGGLILSGSAPGVDGYVSIGAGGGPSNVTFLGGSINGYYGIGLGGTVVLDGCHVATAFGDLSVGGNLRVIDGGWVSNGARNFSQSGFAYFDNSPSNGGFEIASLGGFVSMTNGSGFSALQLLSLGGTSIIDHSHLNSSIDMYLSGFVRLTNGSSATASNVVVSGTASASDSNTHIMTAGNGAFRVEAGVLNVTTSASLSTGNVWVGGANGGSVTLDAASWTEEAATNVMIGTSYSGQQGIGVVDLEDGSTWSRGVGSGAGNSFTVGNQGQLVIGPGSKVSLNVPLTTTGDIEIGLGGSLPALCGKLVDQSTAHFGGTLDVTLRNGFTPQMGQQFDLFDFTSDTGSFTSIDLPTLSSGLSWATNQLYSSGVIAVIPEPAAAALLVVLIAVSVGTRRRERNGRGRILTQFRVQKA